MSRSDDSAAASRAAAFSQEINDIRREAEMAMMEFDLAEPYDDAEREHYRLQAIVVAYITKLRPYLQERDEMAGVELNPNADESVTLRTILTQHGETEIVERQCGNAHNKRATESLEVPVLQPPNALRNAVHILNKTSYDIGFLPESKTKVGMPDDAVI